MFTFLRKIRKSLIDSGSKRKYLLYALGEIALVVIGILIALQINNWNEKSKTDQYELRLLQGLSNSIQNYLHDWNYILSQNHEGDSIYYVIVNFLENSLPYSKSLNRDFHKALRGWYHELNITAFETIKGYGLNFIESQKTVDHISDMYERWHKIYAKTNENRNAFYNSVAGPYLFDHFKRRIGESGSEFVPIDPTELINDHKFRSILEQQQIFRKAMIRWQEQILRDMHESIELLEIEMKRY